MKKLTLLFLLLSLTFTACEDKYPDLKDGVYAEFVTNKGTFVAKLYHEATPLTAANFVSLAEGSNSLVDSTFRGKKFFNGLTFHRIIKDFMIQGGDPNGDGSGNPGYRFPDEFVDSLKHSKKGVLSMANSGPETNGSQFFITLKETPWLDGKHTVFGEIVIGQEIVDSIGVVETTKPGDKPVSPVIMEQVNIIKKGNPKVASFTDEMEKVEKLKKEKEERMTEIASKQAIAMNDLMKDAKELPSGLKVYWNHKGKGVQPSEGSKVLMNYAGYFKNGRLFDSNLLEIAEKFEVVNEKRKAAGQYIPTPTDYSKDARLIPGFKEGLLLMSIGDKITMYVPSHLAYGERGYPPLIEPNSDLYFELELVGLAE